MSARVAPVVLLMLLLVVRPGQVRYQGTDGNGIVRVSDDHGRTVLRFLRDDGGVDATFRRF